MADDLKRQIQSLRHKVHVLEEENALLAERSEDSLLLGLVSASIQSAAEGLVVIENTLERVSVVKSIPFSACGRLGKEGFWPMASYASFTHQPEAGYPIGLPRQVLAAKEPLVLPAGEGLTTGFQTGQFAPTWLALVPFSIHTIERGWFIFIDDAPGVDRLSPMLVLLNQVVQMAAAKHDNIDLLAALRDTNRDLEARVARRTRDLSRAYEELEQEMAERKAMETQLYQSHKFKAIGTLAGGIAHDFNNLLMGIQGSVSLLAADLAEADPARTHTGAIESFVRSASHLTGQLLGLARGGRYEVLPVDLNALVLESATMFGRTRKEIRIRTKMASPPPVVAADSRQIEQVLLNLFINSWQAMPGGGELSVETRMVTLGDEADLIHEIEAGDYARLSVTDTGVGMDKGVCQQIFDPFFTTKEKERGTGLGLASAYGIVKNHRGAITVYSEPGRGTTFNIYLPLTDQAPSPGPPAPRQVESGTGTILIVDDERMILEVAGAMLKRIGYRVVAVDSGEGAVAVVVAGKPRIDLVILDMIMPGMDGGEAFDRIRQLLPAVPVLLSSGYAMDGKANAILERGCNGFIQKPFNMTELSTKVGAILADASTADRPSPIVTR